MKKIGIIGVGTMGNGIAHVSALSGFNTVLLDLNEDVLKQGLETIKCNLKRQVKKENISRSKMDLALERIVFTTYYNNLSDCDVIIEAATENQSIKEKIFTSMDEICKTDAILATNTSSISITAIAEATSRPEKVIGMHFMNPVPIMKLVEVVRGKKTDDDTANIVLEISEKMGKRPVECNDSPGFVTNRILMPMINEGVYCLMEGVGTKEAIDEIMQLGMSHPMGPLKLADLIGLDVCRDILQVLHKDLGNDKYKPCPLLEQMVFDGQLGRKTGQGFYNY
jgi:3-hydroxybutyryl-CoA dehydrogenase